MQEYAKNIARWLLWTFSEEYKQLLTVDSRLLEPFRELEKSSSYGEFEFSGVWSKLYKRK